MEFREENNRQNIFPNHILKYVQQYKPQRNKKLFFFIELEFYSIYIYLSENIFSIILLTEFHKNRNIYITFGWNRVPTECFPSLVHHSIAL